jgi:hypothetical protein
MQASSLSTRGTSTKWFHNADLSSSSASDDYGGKRLASDDYGGKRLASDDYGGKRLASVEYGGEYLA